MPRNWNAKKLYFLYIIDIWISLARHENLVVVKFTTPRFIIFPSKRYMISVLAALSFLAAVTAQSCTPSYAYLSINEEVTAPDFFQVNMNLVGGAAPVVIEVNRTWSPVGADHFYTLLRDGYYDCAAFYTIKTGANGYVQTGIAATSEYTTKWEGYIEEEAVTVARQSNAQYTLAYAASGGFGTRSTHFIINLDDNSYLDSSGFYPFARVVGGLDSLQTLAAENFTMGEDNEFSYAEGGNEWLFSVYAEDDVHLIGSMDVQSSSGGSQDKSGSWAFGIIMTLLSSAACIYGGLYIYRYVRKQQGYDTMSADSGTGSSDRIISLNLQPQQPQQPQDV
jgi:peptidyl-prolyl cis-trans isomerase A (cyclophilin A)